jgi:hypothetical protein
MRNSNLQFKVRFQLLSPGRREIAAQPTPTKMLRVTPMCTQPGNATYQDRQKKFFLDFSGLALWAVFFSCLIRTALVRTQFVFRNREPIAAAGASPQTVLITAIIPIKPIEVDHSRLLSRQNRRASAGRKCDAEGWDGARRDA